MFNHHFFTGPGGCSQHHGCPLGSPHFQNPLPPTRCDKVPEVLVQRQPICVESTLAACATLHMSINFLPEDACRDTRWAPDNQKMINSGTDSSKSYIVNKTIRLINMIMSGPLSESRS